MSSIIGFTGLMGSGKTSIVDLCSLNYKYHVIKLGEYLRKNNNLVDDNINNLEYQAEQIKRNLKNRSIGEFFLEEINSSLENNKIVIVDSIRTPEDVEFFRNITVNFKIVMIVTDVLTRIERLSARKRESDPKGIEEINKHDKWEMDFGIKFIFPIVNKFIINESLEASVKEFDSYVSSCDLNDEK